MRMNAIDHLGFSTSHLYALLDDDAREVVAIRRMSAGDAAALNLIYLGAGVWRRMVPDGYGWGVVAQA